MTYISESRTTDSVEHDWLLEHSTAAAVAMEDYCNEFKQAIRDENGYRVSSLITPIQPSSTAYRLRRYLASSNSSNIGKDLSRQLVHTSNSPFSHKESSAWVEVLTAFWHAGSEISAAKEGVARPIPTEPTWLAAFGAWKEVTKALLKGYSGGNLPAWTVPCLYVSGNFLIQLAVLADEQLSRATGPALSYGNAYQDDVIDKDTKTVNLEDAARFINRLYSLCISDRYVANCNQKLSPLRR